jgi:DNA primase small subunit
MLNLWSTIINIPLRSTPMGLEMPDPTSSEGSTPASDEDISLPDAPPDKQDEELETKAESSPQQLDDIPANRTSKADVKLEDLFDQDDDDEFPGLSSNIPSSSPPPTSSAAPVAQAEKFSDPQMMLQFYSRLFPFRQLFQWLNHGIKPSLDFANREFALTLSNDAYLRYQSYPTADLLRKDILRLNPSRFEIGPVYTTNPRDRKSLRNRSAFQPLSKEIIFDIDLTDYDDVRTCCDKANICPKCWKFATMSIKVIDAALREDFGFEHILWVYSGRRGVHAWISDKDARELDDEKRKALTGYFEVIKGGVQGGKRVNPKRPLHPHLTRSLEILKPYFRTSILEDQDLFLSQAGSDRLLELLPDKVLNDALRKKWSSSPGRPSAKKWADIDAVAQTGVSKTLDTTKLREAKEEILLEYTYPRLDVEVGKKRIHLLKSPFVVHPGTGRVCVPITGDASQGTQVDEFDPFCVPKVTELLAEVDAWKDGVDDGGFVEDGATMRKVQEFEKTSLKPYMETFERFVKGLLKSETRLKRERDEDGGVVDGMDF